MLAAVLFVMYVDGCRSLTVMANEQALPSFIPLGGPNSCEGKGNHSVIVTTYLQLHCISNYYQRWMGPFEASSCLFICEQQ